jgi:3-methyl-2-oxobutanoate hydroxymethyltransferase
MPADSPAIDRPVRLADLVEARRSDRKLAMLTCYDATTAAVLEREGVAILLVGDSAANVVLGQPRTTAIELDFLVGLTAGVRRGARHAHVMADMPFGSYGGDVGRAFDNVCRMVRETGCDQVKLEVSAANGSLVTMLADAGVAVCAHLGLRPQNVQRTGYAVAAKTIKAAERLVIEAEQLVDAGASTVLLEAVPPAAAERVVEAVDVPVIGCGAGPAPMAHVVVLPDLLGHTPRRPKFVPDLGDVSLRKAAQQWVAMIADGSYPAIEHCYEDEA